MAFPISTFFERISDVFSVLVVFDPTVASIPFDRLLFSLSESEPESVSGSCFVPPDVPVYTSHSLLVIILSLPLFRNLVSMIPLWLGRKILWDSLMLELPRVFWILIWTLYNPYLDANSYLKGKLISWLIYSVHLLFNNWFCLTFVISLLIEGLIYTIKWYKSIILAPMIMSKARLPLHDFKIEPVTFGVTWNVCCCDLPLLILQRGFEFLIKNRISHLVNWFIRFKFLQ